MPRTMTSDDLTRAELVALIEGLDERVAALEDDVPAVSLGYRALTDAPFQVSGTRPALVVYTFSLGVVAVLLTLTSIQVDLLSDENNPPTTVRGSCSLGVTANGVGLAFNQTTLQTITYLVPAGHYCSFQSAGAGTATLTAQSEIIL